MNFFLYELIVFYGEATRDGLLLAPFRAIDMLSVTGSILIYNIYRSIIN